MFFEDELRRIGKEIAMRVYTYVSTVHIELMNCTTTSSQSCARCQKGLRY